jgi:hypothetical protein
MKKIIKLSENHYIIVDNTIIKENQWYCNNKKLFLADSIFDQGNNPNQNTHNERVTHSFGKKLKNVINKPLKEAEEAINGYSVEKMAEDFANYAMEEMQWASRMKRCTISSYIKGFNAHKELVKDKLFNLNEVLEEMCLLSESKDEEKYIIKAFKRYKKIKQSKTEWNVEIVDSKITIIK